MRGRFGESALPREEKRRLEPLPPSPTPGAAPFRLASFGGSPSPRKRRPPHPLRLSGDERPERRPSNRPSPAGFRPADPNGRVRLSQTPRLAYSVRLSSTNAARWPIAASFALPRAGGKRRADSPPDGRASSLWAPTLGARPVVGPWARPTDWPHFPPTSETLIPRRTARDFFGGHSACSNYTSFVKSTVAGKGIEIGSRPRDRNDRTIRQKTQSWKQARLSPIAAGRRGPMTPP